MLFKKYQYQGAQGGSQLKTYAPVNYDRQEQLPGRQRYDRKHRCHSLMYPMIIFWEIFSFSVLKPGKELFRQIFSDIYCKITQVPQLLQKITLGDGSPSYLMGYQKNSFFGVSKYQYHGYGQGHNHQYQKFITYFVKPCHASDCLSTFFEISVILGI